MDLLGSILNTESHSWKDSSYYQVIHCFLNGYELLYYVNSIDSMFYSYFSKEPLHITNTKINKATNNFSNISEVLYNHRNSITPWTSHDCQSKSRTTFQSILIHCNYKYLTTNSNIWQSLFLSFVPDIHKPIDSWAESIPNSHHYSLS